MRVLISYFVKNSHAWDGSCGHNFPNVEKAWDWFDSFSKDKTLVNGRIIKAQYINRKVHNSEQLYKATTCNMGRGSVVAQTWLDDEDGKQHLADVRVSLVQY